MKQDIFQMFLEKISLLKINQWTTITNVFSIDLKNGEVISPAYNMKFKLSKNKKHIFILYGELIPFGGIYSDARLSYTCDSIIADGIYKTEYYTKTDFPKFGDSAVLNVRDQQFELPITDVYISQGHIYTVLANRFNVNPNALTSYSISFYDYSKQDNFSIIDKRKGLYLNFIPNAAKHGFHKKIDVKNINSITLR